ncbi:MAG: 30S ribosomal protein S12 methylthiotransferase RimO [Clostridia bacterium]
MNVSLVTLGCTKNEVDSEMILGLLKQKGFILTNNLDIAECIIVNTCGFIESAKKEAIETILNMSDYKINGKCKHLIVVGCLAKRYKQDIIDNMKEVDLVIGVDEYYNLDKILSKYFNLNLQGCLKYTDRIISSKFPSAYIRISDGCDNKCSYCAIPLIRGAFKSRTIEDILEEVKLLASQGISEFVIISQDTSKYGLDIYGKLCLAELLNKISQIEGVKWIRILYQYLYEMTDELLLEMKTNNKICKYFDIPIQHFSDKILKDMNRKDKKDLIYSKIKQIKEMMPEAILRTTIIVGFPGETDEEYNELIEGIKVFNFDRLGAFTYSKEEDTKSFDMKNQIDEKIKEKRLDNLLTIQKAISLKNNKKHIGEILEVVVEDVSNGDKYFEARSYMDAPDVDGKILIKINKNSINKIIIGEYTFVKIIDCNDYDLYAECI